MGVEFGQPGAVPLTSYLGPSTVLQVAEEIRKQSAAEIRKQDDEAKIGNIREKF